MMKLIRLIPFAVLGLAGLAVLGPLSLPEERPNPPSAPRERTLMFVGDVMLSRGVGSRMRGLDDWEYPFEKAAEILRTADLTFGNLECPISDQGRDLRHLYSFRADPRALQGLEGAGFDVVSQANNHTYDWGPKALLDSLQRLRAAGIRTVGAGRNDLEAHYPLIVDLEGLRVGFLAYVEISPKEAVAGVDRPGVAWLDSERVLADIRFARPLVDVLVVCPHWGVEYSPEPRPDQVKLAQQIIDAGGDLIVGSHPHVVQPLDQYRGRWIAYSLGNFVFDQERAETRRGLILKVTVRDKRIANLTMIPTRINPQFQAELVLPKQSGDLTARVTSLKNPSPTQ